MPEFRANFKQAINYKRNPPKHKGLIAIFYHVNHSPSFIILITQNRKTPHYFIQYSIMIVTYLSFICNRSPSSLENSAN